MIEVLAVATMVVMLQDINIWDQCFVYLEFIQCYMSIVYQLKMWGKEEITHCHILLGPSPAWIQFLTKA